MDITDEYLRNKNWFRSTKDIDIKIDKNFGWRTYNTIINDNLNKTKYSITIKYGASNMEDRDWAVHVDDYKFQTIGFINIQTVEQFNKFMELLNINYKL